MVPKILLRSTLLILFLLLSSTVTVANSQVLCLQSCNSSAPALAITDTVGECCITQEGGGYIPLLIEPSQCQPCIDFISFAVVLSLDTTPSSPIALGSNVTFSCDVSSLNAISLNTTLEWIGPNGSVVEQSGPNSDMLDLVFESFDESDFGEYTCTARIGSPDLPPNVMTFVSGTISALAPPGFPVTSMIQESTLPIAGDPYSLTCTVSKQGQTIEWLGPNGDVIASGNGITVGNTISGPGITTSTLSFDNLRSSDTGRYTCRSECGSVTKQVITNFPLPDISVVEPTQPPMLGQPYQPECSGSSPLQDSNVTVTWIGPDGNEIISEMTINQNASAILPITSLQQSAFGMYVCQVTARSSFLDRTILASQSIMVAETPATPIGPIGTNRPSQTDPPVTGTTDIDECALDMDNCSKKVVCSKIYSYYYVRQRNCTRVSICTNTIEGFNCSCKDGFEGDGVTCTDINECTGDEDICHSNAKCVNLFGSFKCKCKRGYIGDGVNCCIKRMDIMKLSKTKDHRSKSSRGPKSDTTRSTATMTETDNSASSSNKTSTGRYHTRKHHTRRGSKSDVSRSKDTKTKAGLENRAGKSNRTSTRGHHTRKHRTRRGSKSKPTQSRVTGVEQDEKCEAIAVAYLRSKSRKRKGHVLTKRT